jgi:isopenicillin N synthase-like dioxygenase
MTNYTVAGIDMSDLYPVPFPKHVPTVKLETISLAKLLSFEEKEVQRLFENCKEPGFFNLDLTDHPMGVQMLKEVVACARLAKQIFPTMSMEEKKKYTPRSRIGIFDMG